MGQGSEVGKVSGGQKGTSVILSTVIIKNKKRPKEVGCRIRHLKGDGCIAHGGPLGRKGGS